MGALGDSMSVSEGLVEAESNSKKSELSTVCLNCGTSLTDDFCSRCGQKNIPKRQTLGELFENFLGSFFSYESKFFRTVKYLLLKPGFLAVEYNAGRRESYYHPARMYVFVSFVFFLLNSYLPEDNLSTIESQETNALDSEKGSNFQINDSPYDNRISYDSAQATLPIEERDGWFMTRLQYRSFELREKYDGDDRQFSEDFSDSFFANSPNVIFFLLPIFALLIKLLYIRRDFYYSEHLVFSIYLYNFFFAVGIITLLIQLVPALDWFFIVSTLAVFAYVWLALRNVYRQSASKTSVKLLLLLSLFSICIGVGLLANLMLTLMLI